MCLCGLSCLVCILSWIYLNLIYYWTTPVMNRLDPLTTRRQERIGEVHQKWRLYTIKHIAMYSSFSVWSIHSITRHHYIHKGQLNSKCLFDTFNIFPKMNENKSTWGFIVVKSNSFVCFLEETLAWKNHFHFVWPFAKREIEVNFRWTRSTFTDTR